MSTHSPSLAVTATPVGEAGSLAPVVEFAHDSLFTPSLLIGERYLKPPTGPHPLPFKVYVRVSSIALDPAVPLRLASARSDGRLDLKQLSSLLYYGYGFSRLDVGSSVEWLYHRVVPSARCLFPTEAYVWLPAATGAEPGVYHYDNLHHRLEQLRSGAFASYVAAALGEQAAPRAACFLTAMFGKSAFKYGDFAYRLCTQEAGLVAGNLQLVAAALGLETTVRTQFVDGDLNLLLGIKPDEERVLAVLAFGSAGRAPESTEPDAELLPVNHAYHVDLDLASSEHGRLWRVEHAAAIRDRSQFVTRQALACADCERGDQPLALPDPPPPMDLADALLARNSADLVFQPVAEPLQLAVLGAMVAATDCRRWLGHHRIDTCPVVEADWAVNTVSGARTGTYRACRRVVGMHLIRERPVSDTLHRLYRQPYVDPRGAPLACYLAVDLMAAIEAYGNRAYRIMHLAAGMLAQRLLIAAATHGLAARVSDAYDVEECQRLFENGPSWVPLFQVILGRERAGAGGRERFRLPFRF
jgi:SagB-type dehydrogenase family enzyme